MSPVWATWPSAPSQAVSPPPDTDLEMFVALTVGGQQPGGFLYCPRQGLILGLGWLPPSVQAVGSEPGYLGLLSMWVGSFPVSGRLGPCPMSPGDRDYLQ